MSKSSEVYVVCILEACERIEQYAPLLSNLEDKSVKPAILLHLCRVLHNAERLPVQLKEDYSSVDWQYLAKMKGVVDDYLNEISWKDLIGFIQAEISLLQAAMEQQLPEWQTLRARMQDA